METMEGLKGRRVLVTGGTGFIGSHLVQALVQKKAQVVVTYRSSNPQSYFQKQGLHKKVIMLAGDVYDYNRIVEIVTRYNITSIFHFAAQSLVEPAYYNPRHTIETNILGTTNILEAVRVHPQVKGVVVASSDKAYGKKKTPYTERDPLQGDHPYEVSKSATDLIATTYFRTYKVPVVITRFGNVYGEGDLNFSRIIPGIMNAIIKKETVQIRSDGTFVRDYVYVKEVVNGSLLLLSAIEKTRGEAFNLSSHESYSVLEVIAAISKILNKKIPYTIENTQKNEMPFQSLNYEKATRLIGYKPKLTFNRTIKNVFNWYKKCLLS